MKKLISALIIISVACMAACSIGKFGAGKEASYAEDTTAGETESVDGDDASAEKEVVQYEPEEGVYADYAFITIGGEIRRYRLLLSDLGGVDLGCVTDDNLLFKWGEGDEWRFFKMEEYPELDRILGLGPGGGIFEASPFNRVDISEIEAVKNSGAVLLLNGSVESGKEIWDDFYAKTAKHMPASIIIADCYTQNTNVSDELKKAEAGDYPCLYYRKLTYDGTEFVLETAAREAGEYVVTKDEYYDGHTKYFKYLRNFGGEAQFPGMVYSYFDIYILTDDDTADWDEIESSARLNPMGAIPYEEVYGEYKWKDNAPYAPLQ